MIIYAKGGGLASSNEIFAVGCSVVEVAFEADVGVEFCLISSKQNIIDKRFAHSAGPGQWAKK